MTSDFKTLVHMLLHRAAVDPKRTAFVFLTGNDLQESRLTYGQLDREAKAVAVALAKHNVFGQPLLLLEPPGLRFMVSLFGCLYAGAIVVPCYPPAPRENTKTSGRFLHVVQDSQPVVFVGSGKSLETAQRIVSEGMPCVDLDALSGQAEEDWHEPKLSQSDVALLQYTSGSTSNPKGVVLTHNNILSNISIIAERLQNTQNTVAVSWLPPYHDMGLISCIFLPVFVGFIFYHMTPAQFLLNPLSWLLAMSRYKATSSAAPNFAYELCLNRITDEQKKDLDLRSWEAALNGAETIHHETLRRFSKAFSVCGFKSDALLPCYGLAESTLWVSGKTINTEPVIGRFSKHDLEKGLVIPVGEAKNELLKEALAEKRLVSNGRVADDFDFKIVNPRTGIDSPFNEVGEIWISGSSVSPDYWNNKEASQETFVDEFEDKRVKRFLKTGDLGFVHDGELYITGRLKDLIIVRGLNYYPQDIEKACEAAHPAVMPNGACAFALEQNGGEQVVVVCEIARTQARKVDLKEVMCRIRSVVGEELELQVASVVLLKQGALPRTTSGKKCRLACAKAVLDEKLKPLTKMEFELGDASNSELAPDMADNPKNVDLFLPASKQGQILDEWKSLGGAGDQEKAKQIVLIEQFLLRQLSVILKLKELPEENQISMSQLGLDSLSQVELHLAVDAEFQISMQPGEFTPSNSVIELSKMIEEKLCNPFEMSEEAGLINDKLKNNDFLADGIPLLPIQQEFLQPNVQSPGGNFVVLLLRTPAGACPKQMRSVLEWLGVRHDAFRLRFHFLDGRWQQEYDCNEILVPFKILNMKGLDGERVKAQATAVEQELLKGFDLQTGPLFRSFFYDRGIDEKGVLCLAFHHIAIDALSIVTLVSEFNQCWGSLERGQGFPTLKLSEPNFGSWASQLHTKAQSKEVEAEADYWLNLGSGAEISWPWNGIVSSEDKKKENKHNTSIEGQLQETQANRLLQRWGTAEELHDLFLAALTFGWAEASGRDCCYVELEHHGRLQIGGTAKPQHTIGWMVHHFPHLVRLSQLDGNLKVVEIVQQLRASIPSEGVGFGLLRFMSGNESIREKMRGITMPKLRFVYRSRLNETFRSNVPFPIINHSVYGQESFVEPYNPHMIFYAYQNNAGFRWHCRYTPKHCPIEKVHFMNQSIKNFLLELCV